MVMTDHAKKYGMENLPNPKSLWKKRPLTRPTTLSPSIYKFDDQVKLDADFRRYTQILIIFIFLIQKICVYSPEIMPYDKLRMPYVTITFVPYAISCIFFKGMSYDTNMGGLICVQNGISHTMNLAACGGSFFDRRIAKWGRANLTI
jgi:hypothetical protein